MNGIAGPPGAVPPGTRAPFGWSGPLPGPWNEFAPSDLDLCYPRPAWIDARLRSFPQIPVGNGLRDPLPVPFTADEVREALLDIYRNRKAGPDRVTPTCARVSPQSVHIALAVLPILEARNGAWIDFDAGRPATEPLFNRPQAPRTGVFNLRCLLYRLPGKSLPQLHQGPCMAPQPSRPTALYNIRDVRTAFAGFSAAAWPLASVRYPPPPTAYSPFGGDRLLGFQLAEEEPPPPEPFTYALFELLEAHTIKGR